MSPPVSVVTRKHPNFYFNYAWIQVEDEIFKVPRYKFESELFWFSLSTSPYQPIIVFRTAFVLSGITKAEFVTFLSVFYPTGLCAPSTLAKTIETWEPVLKVASALALIPTRKHAIAQLQELVDSDTAIACLNLAKQYHVQELFINAYLTLVNREEPISKLEAQTIGLDTSINLCHAREARLKKRTNWCTDCKANLGRLFPELASESGLGSALEPKKTPSSDRTRARPHSIYYVEEIIFLVENELFNVPHYPFLNDSEVFADMFSVPCSGNVEGQSNQKPIVLEGINKNEFSSLLGMLYTPVLKDTMTTSRPWIFTTEGAISHNESDELSWEQLASVLKLSTMWCFNAVRRQTISLLDKHFDNNDTLSIHQLILGQSYHVRSWVLDGYYKLAARQEPLTKQERSLLSSVTIWTIMELRDTYMKDSSAHICDGKTRYIRREITKAEVEAKVTEELKTNTFVE